MAKGIYSARNVRVLGGFVVLAALILAYVMYKPAIATHTPADKVVAAGDNITPISAGTEVELLEGKLRSSKPSDLMIHVTYECSILTKLSTAQSGVPENAQGTIRSWVEIDNDTNNDAGDTTLRIVPIKSVSNPPQDGSTPNSGNKADDGVTFCNRTYERRITDTEDEPDGIDTETDFIDTKNANAFNWLLLNAGSGIHFVRLKADLTFAPTTATCAPQTTTAETCAKGFVGHRTMIVEPAKLANDASI